MAYAAKSPLKIHVYRAEKNSGPGNARNIGMDHANLRNMTRICGGDPEGKLRLLLDYTDRPGEVADPWYTGNFEQTWQDVTAGCRGLLESLV